MGINLKYSTSANLNWTKEHLIEILTEGSHPLVKDPLIINAFVKVDRKDFVPDNLKYLAYNDISIEIGNGVQLNKPTAIGEMLTFLKPQFSGKYLVIGTGTGYVPMLLAVIVGEMGRVYSLERVQWIQTLARNHALKYPNVRNIEMVFRNFDKGLIEKAPFDGIYISSALEEIPDVIKNQLKIQNGRIVCPTPDYNLRVIERLSQDEFEEEIIDLVSM